MSTIAYKDTDGQIVFVVDDVVTIFPSEEGDTPAHAALAAWKSAGGNIASTPPQPKMTKGDLKAYAATKRYQVETGGIVVNGMSVSTDRDSQNMIAGAYAYMTASKSAQVEFKAASGWVTLTVDQVEDIAVAVGAHVQACFAIEKAVCEQIDAGTVKDTGGVDAASWPSNG